MSAQSMLGVIQRLSAELRALGQRTPSAPIWGTVTGVNPLRVEPDTSLDGPLVGDVENAAGPLAVGDRVVLQYHNRKVWVYGPIKNAARYDQEDVNGLYLHAGGGEGEPSFRLSRLFGGVKHQASLYITSAAAKAEAALLLNRGGLNLSRLMLDDRGQVVVNTYTDSPSGSATRPLPFAMASGVDTITPSAANTATSKTITLPAGRFTKTPEIFILPITSVPHAVDVGVNARSATNFEAVLTRTNTTPTGFNWFAVQMEV